MPNNSTIPYSFTNDDNVIVFDAFQGEMLNQSYNFITEFTTSFEQGKRDTFGNGIFVLQKTYRGGDFQIYDDLAPIKTSGDAPFNYESVRSQVFYRYDLAIRFSRQFDRQSAMGQPYFAYLQDETRSLTNTIQYAISSTVIHELVQEAAQSKNVYWQAPATNPPTLGSRGSFFPIPDKTISDINTRADKYKQDIENLIEKFVKNNKVETAINTTAKATDGQLFRDYNFNNTFFKVFIDSSILENMTLSHATNFGTDGYKVDRMTGENPDGSVVFRTTTGLLVQAVRNLDLTINDALKYITKNYTDDFASRKWSQITTLDGLSTSTGITKTNLKVKLIIIPKNEIGVDVFYVDAPQVALKSAGGFNEKVVFSVFKVLAKSLNAIYTQAKDNNNVSYTKLANSDLIGLWSDSLKNPPSKTVYQDYKKILSDEVKNKK